VSRVTAALRNRRRPPGAIRYDRRWEPRDQPVADFEHPISQLCSYRQTRARSYAEWCARMAQPRLRHRKQWEWCFILQVLSEAGVVGDGRRGLGFGVGTEPLVPYLANEGCRIVATDLAADDAGAQRWKETGQHASTVATLNRDGLCPQETFVRNVTFRSVDMNDVPDDLEGFDFAWSSCALEHLGDCEAGTEFFLRQIDCLCPGGVGVHTTEYNVSSNTDTVESGHTVLYRRRDMEQLVDEVRARGHDMTITFDLGRTRKDRHIDMPPWTNTHLKVETDGYVATSFGLVVRKRGSDPWT
jgi:hypothetical protein